VTDGRAVSQDLHRDGATICMVTHNPRFTQHAQQTNQYFDGHHEERILDWIDR